jgi:hypothetical protein
VAKIYTPKVGDVEGVYDDLFKKEVLWEWRVDSRIGKERWLPEGYDAILMYHRAWGKHRSEESNRKQAAATKLIDKAKANENEFGEGEQAKANRLLDESIAINQLPGWKSPAGVYK